LKPFGKLPCPFSLLTLRAAGDLPLSRNRKDSRRTSKKDYAFLPRSLQDEPAAKKQDNSLSVETVAIAATVLLGLAFYLLQVKLARDAAKTDR
jgi:hypothetical protein